MDKDITQENNKNSLKQKKNDWQNMPPSPSSVSAKSSQSWVQNPGGGPGVDLELHYWIWSCWGKRSEQEIREIRKIMKNSKKTVVKPRFVLAKVCFAEGIHTVS